MVELNWIMTIYLVFELGGVPFRYRVGWFPLGLHQSIGVGGIAMVTLNRNCIVHTYIHTYTLA